MEGSISWIPVIFLLMQGLGALAVDPPAVNFTVTLGVQRSGNDVTATWDKLSRPVTNITIRVCPKLERCSVNPRVEVVEDLSARRVQFTVEEGKFYIYSMAVISGGRTYTSRPVEAEILTGLSTGNTVMIIVAVVVVIVVVVLVIILVICLRRRFVAMKGDQYAFTEIDKKERKKSQKRAMAEIVSPRDVKGVLHVSDQNYAVLDENSGKTNGFTNKMALQTLEEEEAFPEIDGRLQIVEPDPADNSEQVKGDPAPESPDPALLNPKLLSMGLSIDSDDDHPDLDLHHDVTPDVVQADVTIATESEPQSPGAVSLEIEKPNLHSIQASSFAESDSDDEDHNGKGTVATPDVAMGTPDIAMATPETDVVIETPEVFQESNPNFAEPDMSGGNDVIEIPEMDIADAIAEMDAVTDEQDGGRASVISSSSSSSTSSSSSSSSDPETDKPEPEIGKPEITEPEPEDMADIDLQAMEND